MKYTYNINYIGGQITRFDTDERIDIEKLLSKPFHVLTSDNGNRTIVNMRNVTCIIESKKYPQ